jgi:hypothetical protein
MIVDRFFIYLNVGGNTQNSCGWGAMHTEKECPYHDRTPTNPDQ